MAKKVREQTVIFDKGLNTSLSDVGYAPHPVRMNNCWLSRDDRGGAVEVIPGYSTWATFTDSVSMVAIGSSGIHDDYYTLYGIGGTKAYRIGDKNPDHGPLWTTNEAFKTGLTAGNAASILFRGDVDQNRHAWFFNGSESPFKIRDDIPESATVSDVGVDRPYADDYSSANDKIYIVAGDAAAGPEVQAYLSSNLSAASTGSYDANGYDDQTTEANNDTVDDVDLGPSSGWSTPDEDGHYVASDTPFGGLAYHDFTAQAANDSKYTWEYWNGSGWQKFRGLSSGLDNMDTSDTSPEVTWTIPTGWAKSNAGDVAKTGPYYWARCRKTAGAIGSGGTTCSRVYLIDQQFGEDEAEGVVQYFISKLTGTTESALSARLMQSDGTEGIDAGSGGTVKIVIDKSDAGGVGDDPNAATYYDDATFKVYRTYQDGAQPYDTGLRIETGDANTDFAEGYGEIEDNIPDDELGNLPYLHGDVPPDAALPAVTHFGRIFCMDPDTSRVYWSDLGNPESFWTEDNGSYAEVFVSDGDKGTALARDRDGILVFKKNHLYKINGRTPSEFYVTEITLSSPIGLGVGTPSVKSLCYTPAGIFFYWNKGVYLYNGSYPQKVSAPIDQDLRAITSDREEAGVALGYYAHRNQVYVSVPISTADPDNTYIFDLDVGQWTGRITQGFRSFAAIPIDADTTIDWVASETGEIFLGADPSATGKAFRLDDGTDFDGSAINTNFRLSPFYGKSINKLKTFLYVDVIFEPVASGLFNLEWWINGESGDSTTVAVTMDKTGYGRHRRRVNIGYKGRSLDLKLKNNASYSGSWKIYGFVIGYIEHESYSL